MYWCLRIMDRFGMSKPDNGAGLRQRAVSEVRPGYTLWRLHRSTYPRHSQSPLPPTPLPPGVPPSWETLDPALTSTPSPVSSHVCRWVTHRAEEGQGGFKAAGNGVSLRVCVCGEGDSWSLKISSICQGLHTSVRQWAGSRSGSQQHTTLNMWSYKPV